MKRLKSWVHTGLEVSGGSRLARLLTRKQSKILMYHRIIDHPLIPAITPAEFEQQLIYLKRHFNVLDVEDLLAHRANNTLPNNSVALTFDDGHFDFYENAWPLLKKHQLPATLYVTTDFVANQCWLWPDRIKHILISSKQAQLIFNNRTYSLAEHSLLDTWNIIASYCLTLSANERTDTINKLADQLSVENHQPPTKLFSSVNWNNLKLMVNEGLKVGSHTVSHRILSNLSDHELTYELTVSKQQLEMQLGTVISGICYPNGMKADIGPRTEKQAYLSGYQYGLAAYPASEDKNQFHIGRWAAPKSFRSFITLLNGLSRNGNRMGQHV